MLTLSITEYNYRVTYYPSILKFHFNRAVKFYLMTYGLYELKSDFLSIHSIKEMNKLFSATDVLSLYRGRDIHIFMCPKEFNAFRYKTSHNQL